MTSISYKMDLFTYGFFTLDSVSNEKELTTFENDFSKVFVIIFMNHLCEIFSDFIKNGKTERIPLIYKFTDEKKTKKNISKIYLEYTLDKISGLLKSDSFEVANQLKNNLIIYPLFKLLNFLVSKTSIDFIEL